MIIDILWVMGKCSLHVKPMLHIFTEILADKAKSTWHSGSFQILFKVAAPSQPEIRLCAKQPTVPNA